MTIYEEMLLARLRASGYSATGQELVGDCKVDILLPEHRLIIEVDGEYHRTAYQRERDFRRERFLRSQGYRVIRVTNQEVTQEIDKVVNKIVNNLQLAPKIFFESSEPTELQSVKRRRPETKIPKKHWLFEKIRRLFSQ